MGIHDKQANSILSGLSDFWLRYFSEIDQLTELYKGAEVLIGQSYLDLMSLVLNASVQDAPIFNKEYFKLIRLRETDVRYTEGGYSYPLPDNVVHAPFLNNKVFNSTDALALGPDYVIDSATQTARFAYDPLNAYVQLVAGDTRVSIRIRTLVPGETNLRVCLFDAGLPDVTVTRVEDDVLVKYGSAHTANDVIKAVNTASVTKDLFLAEVVDGAGTQYLTGFASEGSFKDLVLADFNPLNGFAVRNVVTSFDAAIALPALPNLTTIGVKRGDIVTLLSGPTVGKGQEFTVALIRGTTAYLTKNTPDALTVHPGDFVDFSITRDYENGEVTNECINSELTIIESGTAASLNASSRILTVNTAVMWPYYKNDVVTYASPEGVGTAVIEEVLTSTTVRLASWGLPDAVGTVTWELHSPITPSTKGVAGAITDNGDGTATFTDEDASGGLGSIEKEAPGAVLRTYEGTAVTTYPVVQYVDSNTLIVKTDIPHTGATAFPWAVAHKRAASFYLSHGFTTGAVVEGSVRVRNSSLDAGAGLLEGVDYALDYPNGKLVPLTVWSTWPNYTVAYTHRAKVYSTFETSIASGTTASLVSDAATEKITLTDSSGTFKYTHRNQAITLSNSVSSSGGTFNGIFRIDDVVSDTQIVISREQATPYSDTENNNGTVAWSISARAALSTVAVEETEYELAAWAPDVLVDNFHLYNTFGYLINKFDRSSEQYRSLIKGVFQLFMLGPTLERLESALNTIAGLPVIRNDAELLVRYEREVLREGSEGYFTFEDSTFTSITAQFTATDVGSYIYAVDGVNRNTLFEINFVRNDNTVVLSTPPQTSGASYWEVARTAEHRIITSRGTYSFPRTVPLKATYTNSDNWGRILLNSFTVLTDAFSVTDHTETPDWWHYMRIPKALLPNYSLGKRQVTPELFEHVVNATDEACVGDLGLYVGATNDGTAIPPHVYYSETDVAGVGTITFDPYYPLSNTPKFTYTGSGYTFGLSDVGRSMLLWGESPSSRTLFRIATVLNATTVSLVNPYEDMGNGTFPVASMTVQSTPLVKRHTAAFMVVDKLLKHHLFSIRFDVALRDLFSADFLQSIQALALKAVPAYTYAVVTPYSLFEELVKVNETFRLTYAGLYNTVSGDSPPVQIIGESWNIGTWFRYVDNTGAFVAPAAEVSNPLGVPDAGFQHKVRTIRFEPTEFTSSGSAIPEVRSVYTTRKTGTVTITKLTATTALAEVTGLNGSPEAWYGAVGKQLDITTGSNVGTYDLIHLNSPTEWVIALPNAVDEAGQTCRLFVDRGYVGVIDSSNKGSPEFYDDSNTYNFFSAGDARVLVDLPGYTDVYHMHESTTDTTKFRKTLRVEPNEASPDYEGVVLDGWLYVAPGVAVFDRGMGVDTSPSAVSLKTRYNIVFTTGPNAGNSFLISRYIGAYTLDLAGAPINDSTANFYITCDIGADLPLHLEEVPWRAIKYNYVLKTDNTVVDLTNTPTQDAGTVNYASNGVREPLDPSVSVFDEAAGDTLYYVGMPAPTWSPNFVPRPDSATLWELPVQITRRTV